MSHNNQVHDLRTLLDIPRQDFARITSALFVHLFGQLSRPHYMTYVGDTMLARSTLKAAKASGYIMRNCKLYAYACWKARADGQPLPKPSAFDVSTVDGKLLCRLNLKGLSTRFYAFNHAQYDHLISRLFTESKFDQFIGKFISKKLIFLVRSYGVQRTDLEDSMLHAALYACYRQYPKYESMLHLQNTCKTTIRNTGQNLIQHYTRAKRQALVRRGDGTFEAVNLPLTEIMAMEAPSHEPFVDALTSLVALEHRMSNQVKQFLRCAAGHYDEGLSKFLGKPNDEAVEVLPYPKYLEALRTYFHVSEDQTQKLFSKLKTHIA